MVELNFWMIVCMIMLIWMFEEIGLIIVLIWAFNLMDDNQPDPVQLPPKYEIIVQPKPDDPICDPGYRLMIDTNSGNRDCILGATEY